MTRVYKITVAELIVLHEVLAEYMRELGCDQCGEDLCSHCQRNSDLRQKIIDARSLAEVGCNIVFTTAEELIPKAQEQPVIGSAIGPAQGKEKA